MTVVLMKNVIIYVHRIAFFLKFLSGQLCFGGCYLYNIVTVLQSRLI